MTEKMSATHIDIFSKVDIFWKVSKDKKTIFFFFFYLCDLSTCVQNLGFLYSQLAQNVVFSTVFCATKSLNKFHYKNEFLIPLKKKKI